MAGTEAPDRVLVVEDDRTVAEVVCRYLRREGLEVTHVADGEAGLEVALRMLPDLIVLDLMLPGIDGLEVFRRVREVAPIPIVMLTAKGDEDDRVLGLELGADDYVAKPFSPRELTARVNAVLRRASQPPLRSGPRQPLESGPLRVDPAAREATLDGEVLPLTTLEFELLAFLMAHPREAFSREQLLSKVWGYDFGDTSTVTVHVRRLREKIEPQPSEPRWIRTVWGVGYRFDP